MGAFMLRPSGAAFGTNFASGLQYVVTGKSNPNESISSTILKQNGALNAMVIMVWLHLGRLECSGAAIWSVLKQNSGPEGCGARSRRPLQIWRRREEP